jgi:hypothetical protein
LYGYYFLLLYVHSLDDILCLFSRRLARAGRYVLFGAASMTPLSDKPNWLRLAWQWLKRPKLDLLKLPGENK